MNISTAKSNKNPPSRGKKTAFKDQLQLTSMCAFPALLVLVFSYLPMVGIIIAFKKYKYSTGIFGSEWCGFDNFKFFFQIMCGELCFHFLDDMHHLQRQYPPTHSGPQTQSDYYRNSNIN